VVRKRLAGAVLGGTRLVEELAPQRVMTVVSFTNGCWLRRPSSSWLALLSVGRWEIEPP
jgi:hypothetical protein